MDNLQLLKGTTSLEFVFQTVVLLEYPGSHIVGPRDPAVPLSHEAKKKRTTPIDLVQANLDGFPVSGRLQLSAPPAGVDLFQAQPSALAPTPQFGKHPCREQLPLGVHVAETGRDVDPQCLPLAH